MHNCIVCHKPFTNYNRRTCSPECLAIRVKQTKEQYRRGSIFGKQAQPDEYEPIDPDNDDTQGVDMKAERDAVESLLNL